MASELDRQLQAVLARLTAPGAPLETTMLERGGVALPVFRHAPATLPQLFDRYCAEHADREFLVQGDLRLSFAEVHALARRAAAGLTGRHGLASGDRVGIAARNSVDWIVAYMGVLMAGGCATLLNGWWSGAELAGGIALAGCRLVLADEERAARIAASGAGVPVVTFGHGAPEAGLAALLAPAGTAAEPPALTGDDLATILFTSGSTGIAKGAWSDHRAVTQATFNFVAQSLMCAGQLAAAGRPVPPGQQTILASMPLFHATGEIPQLLQSIVLGRRLVLMARWDAAEAMRLIERERVMGFVGVPTMSHELATHPDRHRYDLSSCLLVAGGGAPRPAEHIGPLREALPQALALMGYGLTETNSTGSCNIGENYFARPASAGPVSGPLVELAILGPDGEALPPGLRGEIAVRSICNIGGYWRNEAETAAALRPDGFFLTGDLGYLDEDGYLSIVDRKKDIIIRGGENIACGEVEQALYSHPAVAEAAVFGMPDARYGEIPVAAYSLAPGARTTVEDLRAHLRARLASFKMPADFHEDALLPRLGSGKLDKRAIKARYSQQAEAAKRGA
jgi:acyl-CoA synthetase (AMP-forming)/AMP-acid ligase II